MGEIYTIEAGAPFLDSLAKGLLAAHDRDALPLIQIFLPTRRACRGLQESFLKLAREEGREALLMPRIFALGDVDEEELSFLGEDITADIPAAMPSMRRQILLARTIHATGHYAKSFEQALDLAAALGKLLDQIYIEERNFTDLKGLVPEEFAAHWQITLEFLTLLTQQWPKILEAEGMIDAADRRVRLMDHLAKSWQHHAPAGPLVIAGTTGSVPATARLIMAAMGCPGSQLILPGLDTALEGESWDKLETAHPQYGMKALLEFLGVTRREVKSWPLAAHGSAGRHTLAREIARTGDALEHWFSPSLQSRKEEIAESLETLQRYEASSRQEEALMIAGLFRAQMENPDATAMLVTPDRTLARYVQAACTRWDIPLDDSGGGDLRQSALGAIMQMSAGLVATPFSWTTCVALLEQFSFDEVQALHHRLLKDKKPIHSFKGFEAALTTEEVQSLAPVLDRLKPQLYENQKGASSFQEILARHINILGIFEQEGGGDLFQSEDGEVALSMLQNLTEHADAFPPQDALSYSKIITSFMAATSLRRAARGDGRIRILGQLEARLMSADLVILGGLNEGQWPAGIDFDPWMSRPMRKDFGLPGHERRLGLSFHDFIQHFCGRTVVLTRAAADEGGQALPSRWLQKLEAVLHAMGIEQHDENAMPMAQWLGALDTPDHTAVIDPPAPCPPISSRPRRLSVSGIGRLINDPYEAYARYILKLYPLEDKEEEPDAAEKGTLIHDILHAWLRESGDDLMALARPILARRFHEEEALSLWHLRIERLAQAFRAFQASLRHRTPIALEKEGQYCFETEQGPFTITAKADRLDRDENGRVTIIDYKTSKTTPSAAAITSGETPQMVLEGAIQKHGGFDVEASIADLEFWSVTGAQPPLSIKSDILGKKVDLEKEYGTALVHLQKLVRLFEDQGQPYLALAPKADIKGDFSEYTHLSRRKLWA